MLDINTIERAWLILESDPPQLISALARRGSAEIIFSTVTLSFPATAEIIHIAQGVAFEKCRQMQIKTSLRLMPTQSLAQAVDLQGYQGYTIDTDAFLDKAIAYIPQGESGKRLQLVNALPTESQQIYLQPNLQAIVSPDLIGKTIEIRSCPVVFPEAVVSTQQALPLVTLHMIGKAKQGDSWLLETRPHCKVKPSDQIGEVRQITFEFSEVEERVFA
jgi:hypothetical protein